MCIATLASLKFDKIGSLDKNHVRGLVSSGKVSPRPTIRWFNLTAEFLKAFVLIGLALMRRKIFSAKYMQSWSGLKLSRKSWLTSAPISPSLTRPCCAELLICPGCRRISPSINRIHQFWNNVDRTSILIVWVPRDHSRWGLVTKYVVRERNSQDTFYPCVAVTADRRREACKAHRMHEY